MRVYHFNTNGDRIDLGLQMKIESEGHRVDNKAPNPDCIISNYGSTTNGVPTFGGGQWARSVNRNPDYASTLIKALGIKSTEVKDGIILCIDLWFNGKEVQGTNLSITDYELMEGNKGPYTSGMGTVVWKGSVDSKLFQQTAGKFIKALQKVDFKGVLNISMHVSNSKFQILDIASGININTMPVLAEMYHGKINDLIYGIASGVNKEMRYRSTLGIGIVLAVAPFPYTMKIAREPLEIKGLNKYNLKHFWMDDSKANTTGRLGTVTARGDEVQGFSPLRDAKRRAVRTINNLTIPQVMYRLDIGNRVEHSQSELKRWGWI